MSPAANNAEHEEIRGLCANCSNRGNCVNFRARGGVWHCNEHSTYSENLTLSAGSRRKQHWTTSWLEDVPKDRKNDFKGLCINCDNRFDCRMSQTDHGIWHCEEYR